MTSPVTVSMHSIEHLRAMLIRPHHKLTLTIDGRPLTIDVALA